MPRPQGKLARMGLAASRRATLAWLGISEAALRQYPVCGECRRTVGITVDGLCRACRGLGSYSGGPSVKQREMEHQRQAARQMQAGGMTVPDIAIDLGITERSVYRRLGEGP